MTAADLPPLDALLDRLPQSSCRHFGTDIDLAHEVLLDEDASSSEKSRALREWLSDSQPCLFARKFARRRPSSGMDVVVVGSRVLRQGAAAVTEVVQSARRRWKAQALGGDSSGLLVLFNDRRLTFATLGPELVRAALALCATFMPERAPLLADRLYLESVPLRRRGGEVVLVKGNCTTFVTGAHLTSYHDHRIPGGLALNVNSAGHYAAALVERGAQPTLEAAVEYGRKLAIRSIGNGGVGRDDRAGSTRFPPTSAPDADRLRHLPERLSGRAQVPFYEADYHIDALVQTELLGGHPTVSRRWRLDLSYLTAAELPEDDWNYGFVRGVPSPEGDIPGTPWEPTLADDEEWR
jgi:hypothetical protein